MFQIFLMASLLYIRIHFIIDIKLDSCSNVSNEKWYVYEISMHKHTRLIKNGIQLYQIAATAFIYVP